MNESHPCPQCGEFLEVPREMLGQPVRCGTCSRIFTPRESLSAVEFDAAPPPRRRRRRELDERETRSSTRRVLLIIFGVIGFFFLLCCGGVGYFAYVMFNPDWQPYDSQTGDFTAMFPEEAQPGTCPTGRGGERATEISAHRKIFQEAYFVYFISLQKADHRKQTDRLLNEFADGLVNINSSSTEYRQRIPRAHAGYEAMDVCLQLNNDHFIQARIVIANDKAYVVGVRTPQDPDKAPWVLEFIDSFQPKDPKAAPPRPANGRNPFRGK